MRHLLSFIMFLVTAAVLGGVALFVWGYQEYYYKPSPSGQEVLVVIERGQGVSAIADKLEQEGVISHALLFRIASRLLDNHTQIKAGEYAFWPGMPMSDVMNQIIEGAVYQRFFTVPEGLTSWQIVKLLHGVPALDGAVEIIPKEGSLLPETYNFVRGDTRAQKIEQMQKAMMVTLDELWPQRAEGLPILSKAEAVILASIVEKETGVSSERKRVAGVFMNRLHKGMKLQTDPTVIYAITEGKIEDKGQGPLGRRLLTKDLQFESPYNTYKYAGLPPGPIANPGKASLEAVMHPEAHDYLYFVADGKGGHVFAKTLEEHNRNVAQWRKIRAGKN